MTTYREAQSAMPVAKVLIKKQGGVIRELGPAKLGDEWALRVLTVAPVKLTPELQAKIGTVQLVLVSDHAEPIRNRPRKQYTAADVLASPLRGFLGDR